ncbi:OmpP1/FadL family transporter [Craterilacuibacter sp.]|uniref:OmpP1/FadL family transporter n=1 Tax=Craterilacuibacter sp. TaxID=2870909 RepID=UPI003F3EC07A
MPLLLLAAPLVHAAGFRLTEQSIVGLGRAHAGAGVAGDDLSAVFYNPAGMSLLNGTQLQLGATYAELDAPFEGVNTTTWPDSLGGPQTSQGKDNGRAPGEFIPNLFMIKRLNERMVAGLGVTVPFGMGARYSDDWVGRDHGISSAIKTVDFNPSLAYRLDAHWSVGGGVSAQYATAKLKQGGFDPALSQAYGQLEADSWAYGYNMGVMYEADADSRIGLSFRSKVSHTAKGDYTNAGFSGILALLNGVSPGQAKVVTPEMVLLSAYSRLSPSWALSSSVRWSNWSRFDTLYVQGSPTGVTAIPNNWQDSWFASLGADHFYNEQLTLRGGLAYETSPVPNAESRNALIPDADRVWLSLGASYRYSKALTLDAGYTYLIGVGDKKINHLTTSPKPLETPSRLVGEYGSLTGHLLGLQLQYRF